MGKRGISRQETAQTLEQCPRPTCLSSPEQKETLSAACGPPAGVKSRSCGQTTHLSSGATASRLLLLFPKHITFKARAGPDHLRSFPNLCWRKEAHALRLQKCSHWESQLTHKRELNASSCSDQPHSPALEIRPLLSVSDTCCNWGWLTATAKSDGLAIPKNKTDSDASRDLRKIRDSKHPHKPFWIHF